MRKTNVTDAAKCGGCPFYRRGLLRRARCEFPGLPIPDSCPLTGGGPKVLKYDAAMDAEVVWMEWRDSGLMVMIMPADVGGVKCGITAGETYVMSEIAPRKCDGYAFRFWDARPTEERRAAEPWKQTEGGTA